MEEKQSFVFYRSFRDALSGVPDDEKIRIYDAIIDYALDQREPEGLDSVALVAFRLIRPQLDANERRRQNGVKNGAKARECGRLGGNPAFKKGQPNPYYAKGRKAEGEIHEGSYEETCEDNFEETSEDSPKDNGKITPEDNPKDKGKISPSGERDIPEDNPKDNGKLFEDIPQETCEDKGRITPSDGCEDNSEDNPEDITEDNGKGPEDNPEITCEDKGGTREDIPEDNGDISPKDKARATEDIGEISREDKGEGGRDKGENMCRGVDLDIADGPGGARDAEKITCEGPEDNPKDKGKISPEDNPEISPAYPANVNANANANVNERDMSLSGKKSVNSNEREISLSGDRKANVNERETSLSGAENKSPAEAVFQGVPEAAAINPEESADKMEAFIERFRIVRDYTGSRLRDVDWEKVADEYDASEYLATMPRYKSLKWIAFNHLTIEGGCYRPKNTGKRADCVERQKPVEGNPFGDWLAQGGDGDKN